MPRIIGEPTTGIQAVTLALRIVEHVVEQRRAVGVTSLAQALGTTKSRIHRHLRTLVLNGYLGQEADTERYRVGPRLNGLARAVGDDLDLIDIATPVLRDLRDTLGHFSVLSQVEQEGVRVLTALSGRSIIEIGVRRGSLLQFHGSAQGKVVLAFAEESLLRRVLRGHLERLTPATIVSPVALEAELARIRERGWSGAFNESLVGLNTVAAPVFDASGAVVAAIGIVDSIQFIEEVPSADQVAQTTGAAARISALLGFRRQPARFLDLTGEVGQI